MKKFLLITGLVVLLVALKVYAIYYYVYSKMTYKFSGFKFKNIETNETTILPLGFSRLQDLTETVAVDFSIRNNTRINARVKGLNLKVVDKQGNEVGRIKTVKQLLLPKNEDAILSVQIENVDETKVLKDFLDSSINEYSYVVSGWLGGIMPIRFKEKIV